MSPPLRRVRDPGGQQWKDGKHETIHNTPRTHNKPRTANTHLQRLTVWGLLVGFWVMVIRVFVSTLSHTGTEPWRNEAQHEIHTRQIYRPATYPAPGIVQTVQPARTDERAPSTSTVSLNTIHANGFEPIEAQESHMNTFICPKCSSTVTEVCSGYSNSDEKVHRTHTPVVSCVGLSDTISTGSRCVNIAKSQGAVKPG